MLQTIHTWQNKFNQPPESVASSNIEEDRTLESSISRAQMPYRTPLKFFIEIDTASISWEASKNPTTSLTENIHNLVLSSYNSLNAKRKETLERRARLAAYEEIYEEEL